MTQRMIYQTKNNFLWNLLNLKSSKFIKLSYLPAQVNDDNQKTISHVLMMYH